MLNIGIIGMGKMGMIHANLVSENPDLKLIAACEKTEERLESIKDRYKINVYNNVEKFLNIKDLDYVVIATTNETHQELTVKALEKGKNVIVEKPMSYNYLSTLKMIEAAEKYNRKLFVHHNRRWDRDFIKVKKVIESKLLGDILLIQSKVMLCDYDWPAWGIEGMANPWRIKKKYGGGILLDWGSHLIDQILLLVGRDPIGVYGVMQKGVWSTEVEDYFFSIIKFDSKLVCQVEASNNSQISLPRWFIVGTKGTLKVNGKSTPVWDEVEISYQQDNGNRENQNIKLIGISEITKGFYEDFLLYLKGKIRNFVSMHDASKVVRVLDLIKESNRSNKFIAFKND